MHIQSRTSAAAIAATLAVMTVTIAQPITLPETTVLVSDNSGSEHLPRPRALEISTRGADENSVTRDTSAVLVRRDNDGGSTGHTGNAGGSGLKVSGRCTIL